MLNFSFLQVLKDEEKRRQYDQFGSAAFDGGGAGFQGFDPNDIPVDMRDLFEGIFSGFGGGGGKVRAPHCSALPPLVISFKCASDRGPGQREMM